MNFIHFIDKANLDSVLKDGIKVDNCYRGNGILIFPYKEIKFKTHSTHLKAIEDMQESNDLSLDEKWEKVGALGLRRNKKKVIGVKIELSDNHWPIEVFIDIHHQIAQKFGELLDSYEYHDIIYGTKGNSLSAIINKISSPRYVLEGVFEVKSESALFELMERFEKAGGGIWGAHSFDCMIKSDIAPESIWGYKEYRKR